MGGSAKFFNTDYRGNALDDQSKKTGKSFTTGYLTNASEDDIVNVHQKDDSLKQYSVKDFLDQNVYGTLLQAGKLEDEEVKVAESVETERKVAAQTDMALKQVNKKKAKPKGGTILTSPLGALGAADTTRAKTLIGA